MDTPSDYTVTEAQRSRKVCKRVGRQEPDSRRRVPGEQPIPHSPGGRGGARAQAPHCSLRHRASPAVSSRSRAVAHCGHPRTNMASGSACRAEKPSDALILGKIKNVDCVLLARHGRQHTIMPSKVNYQANIWALKEEGCTLVIVTTACGSLREEIQPGDMIIVTSSLTGGLRPSMMEVRGVCHIPRAEPFRPKTREVLIETAKKLGLWCHSKGMIVTIKGPRFSSRAESFIFRTWGADVVNMTTVPEVVLAKEAGICYASIDMATDYDCWKGHEEAVSVDGVLKTMKENANKAKSLLLTTIPQIGSMECSETLRNLKNMAQFSVLSPRH